ncbi:MAG TPA: hypothetical protein VJ463_04825 [Geothrix sp.]|nr:hypothetical protein [Geothrix sp.]
MPNPLTSPRSTYVLSASALAVGGLLALSLGCRAEQVAHYRVPKEAAASHPDHPGHAEESMAAPAGTELPAPPAPTGQGALKWSLPKGWTAQGGSGMRYATFQSPVAGKVEATVVVLPGPAGGELANVNRWRNQIGLPPLDEAGLAKARTVLKTKAGALNVYDFTSDGQAKSRTVAGYIATADGNTWFLKMTGDADPVAKARPDFMRILESIHLD